MLAIAEAVTGREKNLIRVFVQGVVSFSCRVADPQRLLSAGFRTTAAVWSRIGICFFVFSCLDALILI